MQKLQSTQFRKHTLMQHMKVVHSAADKLFECDVCKSKYVCKSQNIVMMMIHTGWHAISDLNCTVS